MRINKLSLSIVAVLAVIAFGFTASPLVKTNYTVNTKESKVEWKGEKVTGEHFGTINIKSGNLNYEDGKLTGGKIIVDMTSIVCTDLENADYRAKLEGHLKSPDFFGVESHPEAVLEITKVYAQGTPDKYKVIGNLTIKEATKEIKFYATAKEEDKKVTGNAEIVIDRTDFDVRYGSGSFFDNLGDKTIYDEFTLKVNLVTEAS
ncbi:MAG: YceI family protein [Bacteroidota bacterium]